MDEVPNKVNIQLAKSDIDLAKQLTGEPKSATAVKKVFEMIAKGDIAPVDRNGEEYLPISRHTREKAKRIINVQDWRHAVLEIIYRYLDRYDDK